VQALTDVGVSVPELSEFAKTQGEVPFAQNIAAFPQARRPAAAPTFADRAEAPPAHVPAFLPALPDLHAYTATPRYPQTERNIGERQVRLTEQQQGGEKALVKLQARLAPTNALLVEAERDKQAGAEPEAEDAAASEQPVHIEATHNPFLAPVLWEDGAASAAAGAAAGPTQAPPAAAPEPAEAAQWAPVGEPLEGQSGAHKPFAAWQWTGQLTAAAKLATSGRCAAAMLAPAAPPGLPLTDADSVDVAPACRAQQEDAYEAGTYELNRHGRLQRGGGAVPDHVRHRVQAVLAAGSKEGDGAAEAMEWNEGEPAEEI
jgi:hypothetical protein